MPRLSLMIFLALPALAQKDLPEGEARQYVSQICLQCHPVAQLLSQKRTEADWRKTIARMATKSVAGASGTSEQYEAIAAYMVKNFPKVEDTTRLNMNQATAAQLITVIGLTASEAKALIAFRDKHGEFRQWGDMLVIYGVDGLKIEAAKDKMTF